MRIDPSGTYTPVSSNPTSSANSTASRTQDQATPKVEDSSFAKTSDLTRLLHAVRSTPDVRADKVAEVSARLAAGELTSPQAAQDTAQAFHDTEVSAAK